MTNSHDMKRRNRDTEHEDREHDLHRGRGDQQGWHRDEQHAGWQQLGEPAHGEERGDECKDGPRSRVLIGGPGNDTYYVRVGDRIVEQANAGVDQVYSRISWTLGPISKT